jgi:hypothetical protein
VGRRGNEAKTAPGLGDDDAVARIMRLITNLDREVCAYPMNVIGKRGDVLGTFVGNPRDAVVIDDDVRGRNDVFRIESIQLNGGLRQISLGDGLGHECVHNRSIGNAPNTGEYFPAFPFDLFGSRFAPRQDITGDPNGGCEAEPSREDNPRGAKDERDLVWKEREHGTLPRSIAYCMGRDGQKVL